jgi:isopentenyl-diphosphate delta-isomerase
MQAMSKKTADRPLGDDDPTAVERKRDHIELAFRSQVAAAQLDDRFAYEPLLASHPQAGSLAPFSFLGKTLRAPLWVSSMTGGTALAKTINHNLARACRDFGMGMGLGSCRSLLYSDDTLSDFAVRGIMGDGLPLYANLGIAQLEHLIEQGELWRVSRLLDTLQASGLIIHVNPLQEWLQPEGDRFKQAPLATIEHCLNALPDVSFIVKEVGQGMGPESLKALLQLPLAAIDFAASGGTNFALLELLRSREELQEAFAPLAYVGHSAAQMVEWTNQIILELGDQLRCRQVIISGGIKNFLDGYYLTQRLSLPAVYGQASGFLQHARGDYAALYDYVETQMRGLEVAFAFLKIKQ